MLPRLSDLSDLFEDTFDVALSLNDSTFGSIQFDETFHSSEGNLPRELQGSESTIASPLPRARQAYISPPPASPVLATPSDTLLEHHASPSISPQYPQDSRDIHLDVSEHVDFHIATGNPPVAARQRRSARADAELSLANSLLKANRALRNLMAKFAAAVVTNENVLDSLREIKRTCENLRPYREGAKIASRRQWHNRGGYFLDLPSGYFIAYAGLFWKTVGDGNDGVHSKCLTDLRRLLDLARRDIRGAVDESVHEFEVKGGMDISWRGDLGCVEVDIVYDIPPSVYQSR